MQLAMQLSHCVSARQARQARPVALSCSTSAYLGRRIMPARTLGEHAAAPSAEWLQPNGAAGGGGAAAAETLRCLLCRHSLLLVAAMSLTRSPSLRSTPVAGVPQLPARRAERRGAAQVRASFLGVGAPEAILVGVVALVVFGPKGLAQVGSCTGSRQRSLAVCSTAAVCNRSCFGQRQGLVGSADG